MKKNILSVAISALLLCFCSCSDFLDRYPKEELSDGSFWTKPADAEMFVADIYGILPGSANGDIDGDINSDNAVHGIKWAEFTTRPDLDGAEVIHLSGPVTSCSKKSI